MSDLIVLRALGALLTYPRRELLEALPEIAGAIAASATLGRVQKDRLAELVTELRSTDPFELEERYVALFDTGRSLSLCLFEHVHGDSRERGQAMVDLKNVYERAGFHLATTELPDYLPVVLEYLSCREPAEARDMLGDCAHILRAIGERLIARGSAYAAIMDALLEFAGEQALDWTVRAALSPEPPASVDDDWMDAPAFGPQSKSDPAAGPQVTPIRYMPQAKRGTGALR